MSADGGAVDPERVAERVEELRQHLSRWNAEYYAGEPTVADADFDASMRELNELEAVHPEAGMTQQMEQYAGVEVAAPGAHHQALQRGQPH